MVMIADQTEEDYFRGHPDGKFCEFIDGIVYLHSYASNMPEPEDDPDDPTKVWYDRSSLNGDYMVMIPDQTVEDYLRRAPRIKFANTSTGSSTCPRQPALWHQFDVHSCWHFSSKGSRAIRQVGHRPDRASVTASPAGMQLLEPDLFVLPYRAPRLQIHGHFVRPSRPLGRRGPLQVDPLPRPETARPSFIARPESSRSGSWTIAIEVLIVHRRTEDGMKSSGSNPGLTIPGLPGFWIDVSWLWARPRPEPRRLPAKPSSPGRRPDFEP